MNLPITHVGEISICHRSRWKTYPLSLEMCASQTMHVLVEIHHLESIELIRSFLYLLRLPIRYNFNTFSIPFDILPWSWRVLATSSDCSVSNLTTTDVLDLVMPSRASSRFLSVHGWRSQGVEYCKRSTRRQACSPFSIVCRIVLLYFGRADDPADHFRPYLSVVSMCPNNRTRIPISGIL